MFSKPDEQFKQAFAQWEKQTAHFWNNLLHDPDFLRTAWHNVEIGLQAQQQLQQMAQETLSTWPLPPYNHPDPLQTQLNRLQTILSTLHERADELGREFEEYRGY
ncbi:MAG: hypothetical protein KA314_22110 [Chloroflexi bacterium]|nr:hypothetical protein [Chloroflexota bacterium]MBP8058537.1 hypothetical protein [Chloroflexota bacterium]